MIFLALLLATAEATATAPYPSAQVLAEFGDVCREIEDLGKAETRARSIGWRSMVPDPASPIGQLVAFGMTEGKKLVEARQGSITPMRVLHKDVAGQNLVAVLSGVRMEGSLVNGCRVYDVGETRQISTAEAQRWVGRAPSRAHSDAVFSMASWQPGYAPAHDSFELFFIPAGSPALKLLKVSGVALKADFVGAEN